MWLSLCWLFGLALLCVVVCDVLLLLPWLCACVLCVFVCLSVCVVVCGRACVLCACVELVVAIVVGCVLMVVFVLGVLCCVAL